MINLFARLSGISLQIIAVLFMLNDDMPDPSHYESIFGDFFVEKTAAILILLFGLLLYWSAGGRYSCFHSENRK